MPFPRTSDEALQRAVDLVEKHRGNVVAASKEAGIPKTTFQDHHWKAQLRGFKPKRVAEITPQLRKRLGRAHMVIPDIQAKPGVRDDHLEWIANYALDKRPDVIVQIGDWADMPSLCLYDKGKRSYEGRRYTKDIDAANASLMRFESVLEQHNRTHPEDPYNPEKHITLGNHENRILRQTEIEPAMDGKLTLEDLAFEDRGWKTHEFLKIVEIDGVEYSHYFISGTMGRPVPSAAALLRTRNGSATMGHVQHCDMAIHKQTQHIGLFSGICYLHDEAYLGPQGNATRRQIIMKHEVQDGRYDPMMVSLRYLEKRFS